MMGVWLLDKTLNNYDAFLTPFCPWCGAEMINWVDEQKRAEMADNSTVYISI